MPENIIADLRNNMRWHSFRHRIIADNIANADTPGFKRRDVKPLANVNFSIQVRLAVTSPNHIVDSSNNGSFTADSNNGIETTSSGNAVTLENEAMQLAQNQIDYRVMTSLYSSTIGLLQIATGRGR